MNNKPRKPYPQRAKLPLSVLLWRRVSRGSEDECWLWDTSRATIRGYGVIRFNKANIIAHRAAWIVTNGSIPNGLNVCHKCDNPPCCNPNHLFVGTQTDNMSDCSKKERIAKMKLTPVDVSIAKKMAASGIPWSKIALEFGVHRKTISSAVAGKTWKHVP